MTRGEAKEGEGKRRRERGERVRPLELAGPRGKQKHRRRMYVIHEASSLFPGPPNALALHVHCMARRWLGEKTRIACLETCAKLTSSFLVHTQERRAFILHFRPNQKSVRKRTGNHYLLRLHHLGQCLTNKEIWQICKKDFGKKGP